MPGGIGGLRERRVKEAGLLRSNCLYPQEPSRLRASKRTPMPKDGLNDSRGFADASCIDESFGREEQQVDVGLLLWIDGRCLFHLSQRLVESVGILTGGSLKEPVSGMATDLGCKGSLCHVEGFNWSP